MNSSLSPANLGISCSLVTDCYNCSTITGCHWCPDQACHAYGSLYGCAIGETCASPLTCIRTEPEFKAYAKPPVKAVVGTLFVGVALIVGLTLALLGIFYMWDKRRKSQWQLKQQQQRDRIRSLNQLSTIHQTSHSLELTSTHSFSSRHPAAQPTTVTISTTSTKPNKTSNELTQNLLEGAETSSNVPTTTTTSQTSLIDASPSRIAVELPSRVTEGQSSSSLSSTASSMPRIVVRSSSAADVDEPILPDLPPLSKKAKIARGCLKWGFPVLLLGLLIAFIIALLMFPHTPEYSLCNRNIQWSTILSNLATKLTLAADVDLQFSIYNPNRFSIHLSHVGAKVLYQEQVVATSHAYNTTLQAGSIVDVIVTANFAPSTFLAYSMLQDHLQSKLMLDVFLDLDSDVLIRDKSVYALNTTFVYHDLDADSAADRQYCKCVDPDAVPKANSLEMAHLPARSTITSLLPVTHDDSVVNSASTKPSQQQDESGQGAVQS